MRQNAYFLAKIGADTAENEQHFADICQKVATTLRVRRADTEPAPTVELPQAPEKKKREVSSISDLSQDYREEEKSNLFGH